MRKKAQAASKTAQRPERVAQLKTRVAKHGASGIRRAKLSGGLRLARAIQADSRSMDAFVKSARMVANSETRLRKKYSGLWVAFHNGKVAAHASDVDRLKAELARHNLKPEELLIRKFDKKQRALVV
ncbi:MAG: hypothetical protein ACHQZQ_07625 [SAR324 cluster bacterium]